jgi:NADH dehydrogenase FAD-containing subunit
MVNPDLSVPGAPDVIVIGDLVASILKSDGKPVPGLAPAL